MNDVDTDTLAQAARRLLRVHRQLGWSVVCFLLTVAAGFFVGNLVHGLPPMLIGLALVVLSLGSWGAYAVAQVRLLVFRCPRCGKLFGAGRRFSAFDERCKHCDIDLSPATARTTVDAKPRPPRI